MTDTATPGVTSLAEAFLATAGRRGDEPALRHADQTVALTWHEYGEQARSVATGLSALGVRPGDTVGLLLTNRPEFHVADAAALLLGATSFSMYNASAPEQFEHLLTDAGCRVVVTQTVLAERLTTAVQRLERIDAVIVVDDGEAWPKLFTRGELDAVAPGAGGDDLATLISTSGTTGLQKGLELTHRSVLTRAGEVAGLGDDRRHRHDREPGGRGD